MEGQRSLSVPLSPPHPIAVQTRSRQGVGALALFLLLSAVLVVVSVREDPALPGVLGFTGSSHLDTPGPKGTGDRYHSPFGVLTR